MFFGFRAVLHLYFRRERIARQVESKPLMIYRILEIAYFTVVILGSLYRF